MSYYVVGSDIDEMFIYVDSSGTETTGKVSGDFTINLSKDGVGNQSTTGITIAEIDASNNAGEYSVTIDGSTGFASAVGDYFLTIYDTAAPEYRWSSKFNVTADGNPSLTDGIAFTPTADDGRVTGDDTALSGATVRILDASDNVIAQFTSDSDGLWGPVYLNDSSSYTIHVQASNYSSTTASITTSGGSANGPSADVNIITASTASDLQASKLWAYARKMSHDKIGSKATTQIKQAVNAALGMVGRASKWPFLVKRGRINLREFSNSGTVALTDDSAVVTLSDATWPSWVAGCEFLHNGVATKISTRDSDTQITLEYAFNGTTASAQEYKVFQYKYALPTGCFQVKKLLGGSQFPAGASYVPMDHLEEVRDVNNYGSSQTSLWSTAGGNIAVWPFPSGDKMLNFVYYGRPADLVSDSDIADWDIDSISLLWRAIDYQLSITMGCVAGNSATCMAHYEAELEDTLPNDKSNASHELVGRAADSFMNDRNYTISPS